MTFVAHGLYRVADI